LGGTTGFAGVAGLAGALAAAELSSRISIYARTC